jgi:hypothetical protein
MLERFSQPLFVSSLRERESRNHLKTNNKEVEGNLFI